MNEDLLKRRTEMIDLKAQGVKLNLIITRLAEDYQVSRKALYADWERKAQWLPQIMQLKDDTIVYVILSGMLQIVPKAWLEYLKETNEETGTRANPPGVKIGALKVLRETYRDVFNFLQDLGHVIRLPTEQTITLKGKEVLPTLLDPEIKKRLLASYDDQEAKREAEKDIAEP